MTEETWFVALRRESGGWGRGKTLRAALLDLGWKGDPNTIPAGVEVWLNLLEEADRCGPGNVEARAAIAWESPALEGEYQKPEIRGGALNHMGKLIKIWG